MDNRVEAPSRASGEGSGDVSPGDGPDASASSSASASPGSKPAEAAGSAVVGESNPDGGLAGAQKPPAVAPNGTARSGQPDASGRSAQPAGTTQPAQAQPAQAQPAPTFVPSLTAPGAPSGSNGSLGAGQAAAMAAVAGAAAGAASGARDLASKVGASFSGLGKTKTGPRSRPAPQPTRRPAGPPPSAGAPRPQQSVRSQGGQTRRALLNLERVEPLSVMKFSFLMSLVGWVVLFVAVAVIYFALSKLGVFHEIEHTYALITYNKNHPGSNLDAWFGASRVMEYTAIVCTVNVFLFTALATVGAALYNLVTHLTGGIEVTLKETD